MPANTHRGGSARPARAKKKRSVTPEDLLKFQLVSDPQVSPDGARILFTKKHVGEKNDYLTNLWIVGMDGSPRQFTSGGKDGGGRWSRDGKRVAFTSGRDKPKGQIFVISADGGEAVALTKFPQGSIGECKWAPDGKQLAVSFRKEHEDWTEEAKKSREEKGSSTPPRVIDSMFYRLDGDGYVGSQRHHLYLVDASTGEHKLVFDKDTNGWFGFDWSPDSKRICISANTDNEPHLKPWRERLYVLDVRTGKHAMLPNQKDGEKNSPKWSPDGKRIAFAGRDGRQALWGAKNEHLFVYDLRSGKITNLTANEPYCMTAATLSDTRDAGFGANIRWRPGSEHVFMTLGWHGEQHIASIDCKGGKIEFHTSGPREFALGNFSADGNKIALSVGSFAELNEIHVGKLRGNKLEATKLTDFNGPLLSELEIAKPQEHWIKSASGTPVHVWVMKPPRAKPGTKVPAVLEIHGGPHAQYGVPFFHEFQVLAANGYAVFYSNPRGSKGYGEEHCDSISGDWGNCDWEDVQAVITFMQKQPFVKASKMGVMGGSYGGYMTNWVIGHTGVFAGAITDRCVSNLVSMSGSSDFPNVPDTYWKGNAWDKPEELWAQSPLKYLGRATTPTLIIHSEGDLRCNVEQAEQVFTVLKLRGVPTRFVRYPATTSHGMSRSGPPDLRLHRLHQILDWWDEHLG